MVDINSVSVVLGSIKTATDIAKLIKNSGATLEQAEIKLQIAELVSALADAKIELSSIQAELHSKDEIILELNKSLNLKSNVSWDKPYYWVQDDEDKDGPFCQQCYDKDSTLIRLQGGGTEGWRCLTCKGYYKDKNYIAPEPIRFQY